MTNPRTKRLIPFIVLSLGIFSLGIASLILLSPGSHQEGGSSADPDQACIEPAVVQYSAPKIQLKDLGTNVVSLQDYRGDVVLLNTWATWCPPCRAEMPDLQAFYDKYQQRDFTLVGVNIGETPEQVVDFAVAQQLSFPLWLDPHEDSLRALNTISLPSSVVIDRTGMVRFAWSGATCLSTLERVVAPLILQ